MRACTNVHSCSDGVVLHVLLANVCIYNTYCVYSTSVHTLHRVKTFITYGINDKINSKGVDVNSQADCADLEFSESGWKEFINAITDKFCFTFGESVLFPMDSQMKISKQTIHLQRTWTYSSYSGKCYRRLLAFKSKVLT